MSFSPGRESYHTVKYQIIGRAFICFNHRPGVYLGPGGNLGQAFNSMVLHLLPVVAAEETI